MIRYFMWRHWPHKWLSIKRLGHACWFTRVLLGFTRRTFGVTLWYSTNVSQPIPLPRWPLAQPFRYLAHNGELNTIDGNRDWAVARTPKFVTDLIPELQQLQPLVNRVGSDSSSLDNMFEVLVSGVWIYFVRFLSYCRQHGKMLTTMDMDLRAFFMSFTHSTWKRGMVQPV